MTGIKDVAKAANVSVSTVSYVISGKRAISEETRKKVLKAIDELDYMPDASAQKMRGVRNNIIALSEPLRGNINTARYSAYSLQATWAARKAGYDVLLLTGPDSVSDLQRVTLSNLVDAVILLDVEEDDKRIEAAKTYGKPCVAIGYNSATKYCAVIDMDFDLMGKQAVQYLYDKGHRNIVFIRADESEYKRNSGYIIKLRDSIIKHATGLSMNIDEVSCNKNSLHTTSEIVQKKLLEGIHPTAILSQADAEILNLLLIEAQLHGLSIPDNMSILSCGTFFEAELMRQPVSEFALTPTKLCNIAVSWIVNAIEENGSLGDKELFLPAEFTNRKSVI